MMPSPLVCVWVVCLLGGCYLFGLIVNTIIAAREEAMRR
jgi:hypothetical protein